MIKMVGELEKKSLLNPLYLGELPEVSTSHPVSQPGIKSPRHRFYLSDRHLKLVLIPISSVCRHHIDYFPRHLRLSDKKTWEEKKNPQFT